MSLYEALADHVAPPERFDRWFCDRPTCKGTPHGEWTWNHCRAEQRLPQGDWRVFYLRGGRGSGKTRGAAEAFVSLIRKHEPGEWGIIAPTFGDARDTCVEGPSGILAILDPSELRGGSKAGAWNRSIGELFLADGSRIVIDGADDGALRIQGKNLRGAWSDEIGLWRKWDMAWNESLAFAVRIEPALIISSGTPKSGHGLVRQLLNDATVRTHHLRTLDNAANLAPAALKALLDRYQGTRLGRQELEGELLEDVEGALWTLSRIDAGRISDIPRKISRIVVAVDPSGSAGGDECGIIVAGKGPCHERACIDAGLEGEEHGFVFEDRSLQAHPNDWAAEVVAAYDENSADRVVAERNYGADMVETILRTHAPNLSFKDVHARKGKQARAEPVAALYEQGKVHHVGVFPELEDQLCAWRPDEGMHSPDRLDALVYALTELLLGETPQDLSDFSVAGLTKASNWRVV